MPKKRKEGGRKFVAWSVGQVCLRLYLCHPPTPPWSSLSSAVPMSPPHPPLAKSVIGCTYVTPPPPLVKSVIGCTYVTPPPPLVKSVFSCTYVTPPPPLVKSVFGCTYVTSPPPLGQVSSAVPMSPPHPPLVKSVFSCLPELGPWLFSLQSAYFPPLSSVEHVFLVFPIQNARVQLLSHNSFIPCFNIKYQT